MLRLTCAGGDLRAYMTSPPTGLLLALEILLVPTNRCILHDQRGYLDNHTNLP
jgi:hypothetical protein